MPDMNPRAWHRKASRPVSVWMAVFVLAGLAHPWLPNATWLLVHIFTLGILANSIVLWSQNLTERFLGQRLDDAARPAQLARTYALNAGIVLVLLGATWAGALVVAVVLAWHAWALFTQVRTASRRHPAPTAFLLSACCLPVGALFGAALAQGLPGPWQGAVRQAHIVTNVGGFVGLAAMGALGVLFPAMWRTRGHDRAGLAVWLGLGGVVVAVAGSLGRADWVVAAGVLVVVAGWVWLAQGFVVNALRGTASYPGLSALCAVAWLIGGLTWFAVRLLRGDAEAPVLPLLVGFAGQLLIGTMSYLMPTTMGGGPAAVKAGLRELNRGTWTRVVLCNVGLAVWLAAGNSLVRIAASLVSVGALVAFLPLLGLAVKAQVGVIKAARRG